MAVFYVDGIRYEAPQSWMRGAHYSRVRRGMGSKEAYLDAARLWAEQTQIEADWRAARRNYRGE